MLTEVDNGYILIKGKKNSLIIEERYRIPFFRKWKVRKKKDLVNRWVIGMDEKYRDGFYIGRKMKPFSLLPL